MSWSPLERDRRVLDALEARGVDYTESDSQEARERILELREAVNRAVEGDLEANVSGLALVLGEAQRAAAQRLSAHLELAAVVEAFLDLADELDVLVYVEEPGQMLGAMANVESAAAALEARLAELD